jgi:hypothetical protein
VLLALPPTFLSTPSSLCSGRDISSLSGLLKYQLSWPVVLYLRRGCSIHYGSLLSLRSDRRTHSTSDMEGCDEFDLEFDMGDEMDCDLPVPSLEYDIDMGVDVLQDAPPSSFEEASCPTTPPTSPFTSDSASDSDPPLISHASGDSASQQTGQATPSVQPPRFDPRALLNPTAPPSTSKRPASSGEDADRGRTDIAPPGQVSLVERLHNVHERTASPAKRVKTDEQKKRASSGFGSGALDLTQGNGQHLQHSNGHHPAAKSTAVDLTMSKGCAMPLN